MIPCSAVSFCTGAYTGKSGPGICVSPHVTFAPLVRMTKNPTTALTMTTAALDAILEADFPAAQRGDHDAFARLVRATQRMVASVALAVTRDVPPSEDIVQETYLIAWQKLAAMSHRDSFLPWLRQVARNRTIDQVRKRRYAEILMEDSDQRRPCSRACAGRPSAGES